MRHKACAEQPRAGSGQGLGCKATTEQRLYPTAALASLGSSASPPKATVNSARRIPKTRELACCRRLARRALPARFLPAPPTVGPERQRPLTAPPSHLPTSTKPLQTWQAWRVTSVATTWRRRRRRLSWSGSSRYYGSRHSAQTTFPFRSEAVPIQRWGRSVATGGASV